ncbi:uncharacterized protein N0V89_001772 [Didymosphaeria variabile]|uniref:SWI/SNF family DNA-dependent ATPase Ris1 n=1 Tax=Didymosphaeria variabile TaxID=1932322 RepID=A0A9W8XTI8_9PLEO|nr:uncharacterized protein N0V89_001772 [Didymosphaeria variabile]KAJ4357197.1 hypothetical protein N0V89_001772 [Didymosphaeria variabile]
MAAMPSYLYTPPYDLTEAVNIESELEFCFSLMDSLEDTDPDYPETRAHYEQHINRLTDQLADPSPPASDQSPAESSAVTPGSVTNWGDMSRKRPRELSLSDSEHMRNSYPNSPATPMSLDTMPGAWPGSKRPHLSVPQRRGDIVDLTDDRPFIHQLPMRPHHLGFSDPFPELLHVYQPVQAQSQPADAFVQEVMGRDELAEFMLTPTPAGGGYAYNQSVLPQRNALLPPQLNLGIPGATPNNEVYRNWPTLSLSPSPGADHDVVNSLIEGIKSQDHDDSPRKPTPKKMSCTLMPHQEQALAWLLNMEKGQSKGSLLADEMGLGKTIEGLSLIVANPSENPARKTTLIVAPVALMRQWEKEIERHMKPAHQLRVYTYHRNGRKADFSVLREYDIVLTTFNTLAHEQKKIDTRKESEANDRERREPEFTRKAKDRLGLLGAECYWYRVVLDEAQYIKNRTTLTSRAAAALQAQFRLCMTGTPMQNSVEELYPQLRFLRISAYQQWANFNDHFVKPMKSNKDYMNERGMLRLQALIKSFTLRRSKTTIVDGHPIVNLPPKHVNVRPVEFSDAEHELYKAVETRSQIKLNRYLAKGTVSNNYANILVMLLRLRQICCHPHLANDLGVQVSTEGISEDDLKSRAASLGEDVVHRLKEHDEGFECPICYEADINPTIIVPCGHHTCGECFQKLIDPTRAIQDGNENGATKCPECRGSLSSERITDYRHFCKVFCPEKYEELRRALTGTNGDDEVGEVSEVSDDSDASDSSEDEDDEDVNDPTLGGFIVDDDDDDVDEDVKMENDAEGSTATGPRRSKKKGKGKRKAKVKEHLSLAQLKKLSLRNHDAKKRYLKLLRKSFKSSAKIDETMRLLTDIQENDPTEKTLIFSSFTTLLDLIEIPLRKKKYHYQRYDGSMKFDDRIEAVNEFMDKTTENIMLVSIKAGNAGLNLNKASQVIILDPFWNPFVEDQAVDRAHRMPQQREVHVHRVLVPETVEDRICKLQDSKRELISAALDERAGKSLTRLSINELRNLFGM